MKIDKYLKEKFIFKKEKSFFKFIYMYSQKILKDKPKKSYSGGGIDLLVNYFFRNKDKGIYIDIGCYHPYEGSNTLLLYKRGWSGINIDLDQTSIELFEFHRKRDFNKQTVVSNKKGKIKVYSPHGRSAVQTVSKKSAKRMNKKDTHTFIMQCETLNDIIESSPYKGKKIDFLSIDIEGNELNALRSFNFKKYSPSIVVIEFNDLELKEIEFHFQNIHKILKSDIYKLMLKNGYKLVNWLHCDLVFVAKEFYNKRELLK